MQSCCATVESSRIYYQDVDCSFSLRTCFPLHLHTPVPQEPLLYCDMFMSHFRPVDRTLSSSVDLNIHTTHTFLIKTSINHKHTASGRHSFHTWKHFPLFFFFKKDNTKAGHFCQNMQHVASSLHGLRFISSNTNHILFYFVLESLS